MIYRWFLTNFILIHLMSEPDSAPTTDMHIPFLKREVTTTTDES